MNIIMKGRSLLAGKRFAGRAKCRPKDLEAQLLPFQARWVKDRSQRKIAVKARQIGWTWATAYGILSRKSYKGERLDAWISSRDELQARLFLEDCKRWAKQLSRGAEDLGETVIDAQGHTAYVLALANGLRVHSMSSNPDAQAGKRGDRILDEFALHPDPRQLYAIANPGITWGGSLEIFSTHRGTGNYFNELLHEARHLGNPKGFSVHAVTLEDALKEGLLYKLQQKLPPGDERQAMDEGDYFNWVRAGCPDEESFRQEYMCQAGDDGGAFLSYDQIAACEYAHGEAWERGVEHWRNEGWSASVGRNAQLYIGVDVGRDHDLTVIWVVEKLGDVAQTRAVITMKDASFEAQEAVLYDWLSLPHVRRCCIDQTGIGRQFAERARQRFGIYRVEGIHFTAQVKEELAYPVRAAFESRLLRIPSDAAVRSDLRAIKKETTASQNIRFTADRGKNGHADRFWALALALHAGKQVRMPRATLLDDEWA